MLRQDVQCSPPPGSGEGLAEGARGRNDNSYRGFDMSALSAAPLALLCAVPFEGEQLARALEEPLEVSIGRKAAQRGTLDGVPVVLFPVGMGKTNAAQGLTALLERQALRGVIGFGVGGAYPGAELEVAAVALASHEVYADEGVATPRGWLSTEGIGIPLLQRGELRRFNDFPLDADRVAAAERALAQAGIAARVGPFATVSCCSGTAARGVELAQRFGAICESMEGAALAHVCELYGVPFLEVRGISNAVEDRDLSRWRLAGAASAAARAVRTLVRHHSFLFPHSPFLCS
ncbi:futalosine hydrolase [soil metagenome]